MAGPRGGSCGLARCLRCHRHPRPGSDLPSPRASPMLRSVNVLIPAWPAAHRLKPRSRGLHRCPPRYICLGDSIHPSRVTSAGRATPQHLLILLLSFVLFFRIKDKGMFAQCWLPYGQPPPTPPGRNGAGPGLSAPASHPQAWERSLAIWPRQCLRTG